MLPIPEDFPIEQHLGVRSPVDSGHYISSRLFQMQTVIGFFAFFLFVRIVPRVRVFKEDGTKQYICAPCRRRTGPNSLRAKRLPYVC